MITARHPPVGHLVVGGLACALMLAATVAATAPMAPSPCATPDDLLACRNVFAEYLEAVHDDQVDQALRCWRDIDVRTAERLDIHYLEAPLKVDGDSPLWLRAPAWRAGQLACRTREPACEPGTGGDSEVVVTITLGDGTDAVPFTYHFAREDGRWLLASPVALACSGQPDSSSRFVRLVDRRTDKSAPRSSTPSFDLSLATLDSCIDTMMSVLAWPAGDRERLERGKLGYLLADPDDVARLAGAPTVGVANLQQDVVITSHPCHAHELAHLVINAWLRDPPLFMLPLLQEGIAVHLGGRVGRHPRVLERVGRTSLADGWVTLGDLLTRDGFQAQPADLTYAPAGVFAGFILRQYGAQGLRDACLAAGDSSDSSSRPGAGEAMTRLARALDTDWSTLERAFADYVSKPVGSGIQPGGAGPALRDAATLHGDRLQVVVGDEAGAPEIDVMVHALAGDPHGAILFGGGAPEVPLNALFSEHFPGRPYRGETHALIFTNEEAKLYDYRLQMLVALHAEGFWPSETYLDADHAGLRCRVDRALWPVGTMTMVDGQTD